MNGTAVNLGVLISFPWIQSQEWDAGTKEDLVLVFRGLPTLFPTTAIPISIPTNSVLGWLSPLPRPCLLFLVLGPALPAGVNGLSLHFSGG